MDALIQKYLDGELTDEESRVFLEALASDIDLNNEVRALEDLVDIGSGLESPTPSDGFTDRVMEEVSSLESPLPLQVKKTTRPVFRRSNLIPLAASWTLALGLGYFLSQGLLGNSLDNAGLEVGNRAALTVVSPGEASISGLNVVRFV
jgi:anti-sigma factor RsiW